MGSRPGDIDEPKKEDAGAHHAESAITPRAPSIKPPRPTLATRPTVRPLNTLASSASASTSASAGSNPPPKNTLTFPPKTDQLPADLAELISNAETLRPPAPAPTVPPPSSQQPRRIPSAPGLPVPIPAGVQDPQHVVRWTTPNRRPLAPRAVERAARSSERFLTRYDEPSSLDVEELSQRDLISERPPTAHEDPIPSDRSTVPMAKAGRGVTAAPPSSKGVLELAENDLESDPIPLVLQPAAAGKEEAPLPNRLFRTPIPPAPAPPPAPTPSPSPSPIADTRVTEPRNLSELAKEIADDESDPAPPPPPPTSKRKPTRQEAEAQLRAFLRASPPSPPRRTPAPLDDDEDTEQSGPPIEDQEPHLLLLLRSNPPNSARVQLPPADHQQAAEQAASTVPPTPTPALSVSPNNSSAPPPPTAISTAPTKDSLAPLALLRRRRTLIPLIASHVVLAAGVALIVSGRHQAAHADTPREPRIAIQEWSPLAGGGAPPAPSPPSGGCATSGNSRLLASSAQIGPGLDVTVLDTGFAVGLAAKQTEAVGLRVVEGSGLRVAETVRVKSALTVSHVVVDREHEDDGEGEGLDVRIDEGEARTVLNHSDSPTAAASFKIVARGGAIMALTDNNAKTKILWPVPGGGIRIGSAPAPMPAAQHTKANPYAPPGFSKLPSTPRPAVIPIFAPEVMRAAGRDDGGAVVALRRPAMLWLGVTDSSLTPAGPLVSILRKPGTVVGTPAVAQWGGGGVVAWAEKPYGERDWVIVVAGFSPDGEGKTHLGHMRVIGKGMSPTIAALPDGDLLLGYADGPSGAHRVVARRLAGTELEPRGDAVVVSPESVNAGQPVAAVRADGRALIAYFATDSVLAAKSAGRAAAVHATPLACDPGL